MLYLSNCNPKVRLSDFPQLQDKPPKFVEMTNFTFRIMYSATALT